MSPRGWGFPVHPRAGGGRPAAWGPLSLLAILGLALALAPSPGWAQGGGRLGEAEYTAWQTEHAAALDAAAAALAEAAPETRSEALATLARLADAASRVRAPESLLEAHARYLIAVERLRLAALAVAAPEPAPAAAEALARARDGLRALLASGVLPPADPGPPLSLPPPSSQGLASVHGERLALTLLGVQRPYTPRAMTAPAGQELLALRVRVQNLGTDPLAYYPLADFVLLTADGVALRPVGLGVAERQEAGTLEPGDALITTVTFVLAPTTRPVLLRFAPMGETPVELPLPASNGGSQSRHDRTPTARGFLTLQGGWGKLP